MRNGGAGIMFSPPQKKMEKICDTSFSFCQRVWVIEKKKTEAFKFERKSVHFAPKRCSDSSEIGVQI
jgi:hypothetical protein